MTIADIKAEPIAVWDTTEGNDSLWSRHCAEASRWAVGHFGAEAHFTYRAEFYLLDAPFTVLHRYARNENGFKFKLPGDGGPVLDEPLVKPLHELPPAYLLGR